MTTEAGSSKLIGNLQGQYRAENARLLRITTKLVRQIKLSPPTARTLPVGFARGQNVLRTAAVVMQALADAIAAPPPPAGTIPPRPQPPAAWIVLSRAPTQLQSSQTAIAPSILLSNFNPSPQHRADLPGEDPLPPARLADNPYYGLPYLGSETDAPQLLQRLTFQLNPSTVYAARLRSISVVKDVFARLEKGAAKPLTRPIADDFRPAAMAGGSQMRALRSQALTPAELDASFADPGLLSALVQALTEETTRRLSSELTDEHGRVRIDAADGKYAVAFRPGQAGAPATLFWNSHGARLTEAVRAVAVWARQEKRDWASWRPMWDRGCNDDSLLRLPVDVWASIEVLDEMADVCTSVAVTVFRTSSNV